MPPSPSLQFAPPTMDDWFLFTHFFALLELDSALFENYPVVGHGQQHRDAQSAPQKVTILKRSKVNSGQQRDRPQTPAADDWLQ